MRSSSIAQSGLPFEVLAEIFCSLVPPSGLAHGADHYDSRCHGRLHWYTVLYVCRGWRAVARNCADFWTFLPLWDAVWTRRALELSSPKLVTIDTRAGDQYLFVNSGSLSYAFVNVSRAREIYLLSDSSTCDADSHLQTLRASQAPFLEVFEIDGWSTPRPRPGYVRLPGSVFESVPPPRLRKLQMQNVEFHWNSSIFSSSITHLDIITNGRDVRPEFDVFLRMANLEYLSLSGSQGIPWFQPTSSDGRRRALSLDRLKTLKLEGPLRITKRVLQTIEARCCEDMTLEFRLEYSSHDSTIERDLVDQGGAPVPSVTESILSALCVDSDGPNLALTRLYIWSEANYFPSAYSEATNLFRNVPNLTDLTVIGDEPMSWLPDPVEGTTPVYMPHLKRLFVSSDCEEFFRAVAECILIPESAEYHVQITSGHFSPETATGRLCGLIRRILRLPTRPDGLKDESSEDDDAFYTTLELKQPGNRDGMAVTASNPKCDAHRYLPRTLKLSVFFAFQGMYFDKKYCPEALRYITSTFPLSGHDSLEIKVDHPYFEENPAIFGRYMRINDAETMPEGGTRAGNEYCVAVIRSALAKARKVG